MSPTPHKLSHKIATEWEEFSFPPLYERQRYGGDDERLLFGVPSGDIEVIRRLLGCMEEPFCLLYVLHSPRGEGPPVRYQSPELPLDSVHSFLIKYAAYFRADARYDLWLRSLASTAMVAWDRHNRAFAYGPVDCFVSALVALGFSSGEVPNIPAHVHHYRAEFDPEATSLL